MIFGTTYPVISGSLGVVALEHSKINYKFFNADIIEHRSVLTGHLSYPYARNKSTFQIDILLCEYADGESSSLAKFNDIYKYKDSYFNFYPHADGSASLDVYQEPIEYFITEFVPYYLSNDVRYDGVLITIEPRKNSVLFPIRDNQGWGLTPWGLNWGL